MVIVLVQEYLVEPLLIDLQNDLMCFMFSNEMNISTNVFKFEMNFPDVYKISQSMYHIIENFKNYSDILDELDLAISYIPIISTTEIVNNQNLFIDTIEKLSNYSIDSITNNFFWSSPLSMRTMNSYLYSLRTTSTTTCTSTTNTTTIVARATASTTSAVLEDTKRRNVWNKMTNNMVSSFYNNFINEDPCAFKSLTLNYVEVSFMYYYILLLLYKLIAIF